jgi:hypothetical protein
MNSRSLLVGLDNPANDNPFYALSPEPPETGARIIELIKQFESSYSAGQYLWDFYRANLYPMGHAPMRGKGYRSSDRCMTGHIMAMLWTFSINDIVMLGGRVENAFRPITGEPIDPLKSAVVDVHGCAIRFWSLPFPDHRNHWYTNDDNKLAAGKLLHRLRPKEKQHESIPHR